MLISFNIHKHGIYLKNTIFSVGTAKCYGLDGMDSIPDNAKFFSSPQRPDRLWGLPSLLSNRYEGCFLEVKAARV
jgi:hypothetical protein